MEGRKRTEGTARAPARCGRGFSAKPLAALRFWTERPRLVINWHLGRFSSCLWAGKIDPTRLEPIRRERRTHEEPTTRRKEWRMPMAATASFRNAAATATALCVA